ncbi:hypothetical protein CCACVL1_12576 [Corchorus capsularis]|uniref:Uncharacterized protein n=1 Tax=Corchorus capsularis TaxID=210143 RepID=A0A1R3IEZ6_COCAP|nr:hypothetical protein CCACVL1_12576 [Corchorus capsularis]
MADEMNPTAIAKKPSNLQHPNIELYKAATIKDTNKRKHRSTP